MGGARQLTSSLSTRLGPGPSTSSGPGPSTVHLSFTPHQLVSRDQKMGSKRIPKAQPNTLKKARNTTIRNPSVIAYDSRSHTRKQFSTKDANFVITGLVELDLVSDEITIRQSIAEVIQNST